jgi:hypothetical protein
MAMGLEDNKEMNVILNDITACISLKRIDDMMYMFLHIFPMLGDKIITKTEVDVVKEDIEGFIKSKDNISLLDLFYKIYEGESGNLLLDPTINDDNIYQLESYVTKDKKDIYMFVWGMRKRIVVELGKVKKLLLGQAEFDFNF